MLNISNVKNIKGLRFFHPIRDQINMLEDNFELYRNISFELFNNFPNERKMIFFAESKFPFYKLKIATF